MKRKFSFQKSFVNQIFTILYLLLHNFYSFQPIFIKIYMYVKVKVTYFRKKFQLGIISSKVSNGVYFKCLKKMAGKHPNTKKLLRTIF